MACYLPLHNLSPVLGNGLLNKFDNFRSKKLTDSARDQPCTNCGAEDGTTVSAHSNWPEHGKGGSMKASDEFIAHLCHKCHAWLDQGSGDTFDPSNRWLGYSEEKKEMWRAAHDKTIHRLFITGKLKVAA